ncbi:MAG: HlyD family type I secretion periplasmic adaptor subunit [Methyloceanibacter sp.]
MTTKGALRLHFLAGVAIMLLLVAGLGSWAVLTEISGAVIAPGTLVARSRVQEVQHPNGGIVAEIRARDGDTVKAGDVLVRLDGTITRVNLAIVTKSLDELSARKARLVAEQADRDAIVFADDLLQREHDAEIGAILDGERRLFEVRRAARLGQKKQLAERVNQLKKECDGYTVQAEAKSAEIALINRELEGARTLWQKNLMPISKLTELERNRTRIEGERGQFIAALAQAKGKIAETELQILQVDLSFGSEVGSELREVEAKLGELVEKKVAAEDQLTRLDIVAPQDGVVHESTVHTVGGVIAPGKAVMLVVPTAGELVVEVKVAPADIDQLRFDQDAGLRFSAFNQRTTPEINGTVSRIGADVSEDERTGQSYYTVDIAIRPEEVARLGQLKLVPGMPVEAFIKTEDRTVMSYLVKPLGDQIARAFRES